MSKLNLRTFLKCLYRRMARLERAVLLLLCIFAVKFVFSTAAHFAAPLQVVDMLGSGRNPVDVWLLLLCCTAVLGTFCLYRRAARAIGAKCTKADAVILAVCIAASAAFYLHAMVGRQSLYLWDNATYYNLQVRLESNFADGVFTGVGSTIYKTWFNDYAPLVINLLAEPFFMFTPRTANTFALLCALLIPSLVYYSAWLLLTVLRRKLQPKAPVLFTALSMAFVLLLPLLHIALYRGMPDLLGVAFAFMLLALGVGYDFSQSAPARLVSLAAFTGMLMLTRRSYMFTVVAFFLLYGVWVLARAARARQVQTALRFGRFAAASLVCVGVPLLPMFWRIAKADYSDRYATYQTGGFLAELANQRVYLGWLVFVIMLIGILYGLYNAKARALAVLAAVAGTAVPLAMGCSSTSRSISSATARISHWARLQQRRLKKFCKLRQFIVMTIFVSQALGSTKRASSLACLDALARAAFSSRPSAINRAVWAFSSVCTNSRYFFASSFIDAMNWALASGMASISGGMT